MLPKSRISLAITVFSMVVLSCAAPALTLPASDAISTSAAQTVIAGFVQTALSQTLQPSPTLTFTPGSPTFSPTSSFTPSPTLTPTLAFTPTPLIPQINVSVPTNCRVGPGKVYRRVGALLVGEVAEVYGRDPTGRYWYIRNPDSPNGFCWLWGEYATVVGNTALLPVYTPPPTPTPTFTPTPSPAFTAVYDGLESCTVWWVEIELSNTGTIPFESIGLTVRDTATNVVLAAYTDEFINYNGCQDSNSRDVLGVGKTRVVSAPAFNYDPTGHELRATIILCSDDGQNGTCVTKTIHFKP